MKITITITDKNLDYKYIDFIYNHVPKMIKERYLRTVDDNRFSKINHDFNINSDSIIRYALDNLDINSVNNVYIISVDKNLRVNKLPIMYFLNLITYGNLTHKGYPILLEVFKSISEEIDSLFKEYDNGD